MWMTRRCWSRLLHLRYIEGQVRIIEGEVANDSQVPGDRRTAEIVRTVASEIFDCLLFTADSPTANVGGKMPVLDLQVWLEKDEQGVNHIRHQFYEKPMSSQLVIHKQSAMSWTIKRSALVSEVFRRLFNTDDQVSWQEKADMISKLVLKMWRSGYREDDITCFV